VSFLKELLANKQLAVTSMSIASNLLYNYINLLFAKNILPVFYEFLIISLL
jgi:hypothetical protein